MGRIHGWLFAGFTFLFIVLVIWGFWARPWLLPLASDRTGLDTALKVTLAVTGLAFVITQFLLGYFTWRYRAREGRTAAYWHDNPKLEIAWTTVTALILTVLVVNALRLWAQIYTPPPPGALVVEVTGQQFAWNFRYPGEDGRFGRTDPTLVSVDNPLGIDDNDPASADDIWLVNELYVPVGRPVHLRLRSRDVIHSFFLPHFRVKQDAVPGMTIDVWFVPEKTGTYEIACAEHCGLGHYRMRGFLYVVTPEEFQEMMESLPRWIE